jgi:hypothetical protein
MTFFHIVCSLFILLIILVILIYFRRRKKEEYKEIVPSDEITIHKIKKDLIGKYVLVNDVKFTFEESQDIQLMDIGRQTTSLTEKTIFVQLTIPKKLIGLLRLRYEAINEEWHLTEQVFYGHFFTEKKE